MKLIFYTPLCLYKIVKTNIFFRPEEAMLQTGKSLSLELKIVLFLRKFIGSL